MTVAAMAMAMAMADMKVWAHRPYRAWMRLVFK
jgi:hypothetical protein